MLVSSRLTASYVEKILLILLLFAYIHIAVACFVTGWSKFPVWNIQDVC